MRVTSWPRCLTVGRLAIADSVTCTCREPQRALRSVPRAAPVPRRRRGGKAGAVEVHQLRGFVAEESHFGRAADRLHLTPSPVSRAVRDLERELGAELFVRRYHQVELTPLGRELLPQARDLLAGLDNLRRRGRTAADAAPRVLH